MKMEKGVGVYDLDSEDDAGSEDAAPSLAGHGNAQASHRGVAVSLVVYSSRCKAWLDVLQDQSFS